MAKLYNNKIGDNFSEHSGQLTNYLSSNLVSSLSDPKHYNIRAFHAESILIPFSSLDDRFWEHYRYDTLNIGDFRSINGLTTRAYFMSELDALTMATLDPKTMFQLENLVDAGGMEAWPSSDGNVVVGKDSTLLYSNRIAITLPTINTEKIVSSFYPDDLLTDFQDDTYYIELVLRNFPAQAATAHLNLTSSFVEFSTDTNFTNVASLSFSSSLNSLSAGGDLTARWARSSLTGIDLSKIVAIRFRIRSAGTGSMTFTAQAMRLVGSTFPLGESIDTKRKWFVKTIPRTGTPSIANRGGAYFATTRPLNSTVIAKFNSGHNHASSYNIMRVYLRAQNGGADQLEVNLQANTTESRLKIINKVANVETTVYWSPATTNILTNETDYLLVVTLNGQIINASIYAVNTTDAHKLGSLVYTTGDQVAGLLTKGFIGYSFEPFHYDFTLDFLGTNAAEFGYFESKSFNSVTPLIGASLFTSTSPAINILDNATLNPWGDITLTHAGNYIEIKQLGGYHAGVVTASPMDVGDTSQVTITGEIYPVSEVSGTYRVALVDENDVTSYIGDLADLLPNQWNSFELPLTERLFPNPFYFYLEHFGLSTNTVFRFRNLKFSHNTISWQASNDNGSNYQPFYNTINKDWGGIRFPESLRVSIFNMIKNPSVETNLTGWPPSNGSISQSTLQSKFGTHSALLTCNVTGPVNTEVQANNGDAPSGANRIAALSNTTYTVSVYHYQGSGSPNFQITANEYNSTNTFITQQLSTSWSQVPNTWIRHSFTFTTSSTTAYLMFGLRMVSAVSGNSIYLDGLQLEKSSTMSTYVDGDQLNCFWTGSPHSSQSFSSPGKALKVKATAVTDLGWIQGYILEPRYLPPGR